MNIKDKKIKKLFDDLKELKRKLIREIDNEEDIENKKIFLEDLFLIDSKSSRNISLKFENLCFIILQNILKVDKYTTYYFFKQVNSMFRREYYNAITDFFESNLADLSGEQKFKYGYKAIYKKTDAGLEKATELCENFRLSSEGIYPITYNKLEFLSIK